MKEEPGFEEENLELKIVEQSALNHFNAILQKAQSLATKAEKENPEAIKETPRKP